MAYGSHAFNTIQLGREDYPGTPVAATWVWRGPAVDIEDQTELVLVDEDIGLLLGGNRGYSSKAQALLAMPETEVTFEQVLHILEAGIGQASITGGPLYIPRVYRWRTLPNAIKTYTLETGNANSGDASYMAHSFVEELSFSGSVGEAWKMSATWRGLQKGTQALTAAPTMYEPEEALFSNTTLYIDDAVLGSTSMDGVMTAANVNIKTGIQAVWSADGQLYFYTHKFVRPEVTWSISLELESGGIVAAERAAYAARTLRLIRLDCPGSDATRNFRLDLVGNYTAFSTYNNQDGNTIVEASGVCLYDPVFTQYCTVTVLSGDAGGIAVTNDAVAVTHAAAAVWQSDMTIT